MMGIEPHIHSLCLQLQWGYCSYLSLFCLTVASLKSLSKLKTVAFLCGSVLFLLPWPSIHL